MDEPQFDETTSILMIIIEDRDASIKALSNKPEGYNTCTRCLL